MKAPAEERRTASRRLRVKTKAALSYSNARKRARPALILTARIAARLTQAEAAAVIGYSERAWQEWEGGRRKMRAHLLDLFEARVKGNGSDRLGS
jgi:DNA-binding transcriptional regulator YiaG